MAILPRRQTFKQLPEARAEGDRILERKRQLQAIADQRLTIERAKDEIATDVRKEVVEEIDDLKEGIDRLKDLLPGMRPAGGGKRMISRVLSRDFPHLVTLADLISVANLVQLGNLDSVDHLSTLADLDTVAHLGTIAELNSVAHLVTLADLASVAHLATLAGLPSVANLTTIAGLVSVAHLGTLANLTSVAHLVTLANLTAITNLTNIAQENIGYQVLSTDAAFTLTPRTSPRNTVHTGTLTAARAVTLSTTNAYAGESFVITRTGGGAFPLNVGTGPLAALNTGEWARVVYSGSAWVLAERGLTTTPGAAGKAIYGHATQADVVTYLGIVPSDVTHVANVAALQALATATNKVAFLKESGREGTFVFDSSNLSAKVTADTRQGVYIAPASAPTGASGAWVRQFQGPIFTSWFGAKGDAVYHTGNVSITSGTAALTVTGANFVAGDVGKKITIPGAGAAGVPLVATINARVSATQLTLSANAGTTLAAVSSRIAYGTDDTDAVNRALLALPINGGEVRHAGMSIISASISLGDGTPTTVSTRWGMRLVGEGHPIDPSNSVDTSRDAIGVSRSGFIWAGTYNSTDEAMIDVKGYLNGFEVSNFRLDGRTSCRFGLRVTSSGLGETNNLGINDCITVGYITTVHTGGVGFNRNAELINGHNIVIRMAAVANNIGAIFDGKTDGAGSSCFITLTGLRIFPVSTHAQKPLIFKVADTVTVNDLLIFHATAAHASTIGVTYDYSGNATFPCGCIINGCDVGWELPAAQQFGVAGSSATAASANLINNLTELNECRYPNLGTINNVTLDLPRKVGQVDLGAAGSAVASTLIYTPKIASRYRISYYLSVRTAGSAGTITLVVSFQDSAGIGRNVFMPAHPATDVTNSVQGSFLISCNPGGYISYQVTYTGVTGTPVYDMHITVERLS